MAIYSCYPYKLFHFSRKTPQKRLPSRPVSKSNLLPAPSLSSHFNVCSGNPRPPPPKSHAESVTRIPASRLTGPNDLDDLRTLQPEVAGDGIGLLDAGQLGLLEAVALEEGRLLVAGEDDVAGHELVVGDVDEEVGLEEALNLGEALDGLEGLAGGGGEGRVRDHDARLVAVGDDVARELADLAHAKVGLGEELDPDGAAVGRRVRVGGRLGGQALAQHGFARVGGELKLRSTAQGRVC